jgi:hypothetical protein
LRFVRNDSCRIYANREADGSAQMFSLNSCPDGTWCCNNITVESCCQHDQGAFIIQVYLSMVSIEPTLSITEISTATITTTVFGTAPTETLTPVNCPQDRSTVVGASVGAALGGTLVATLLVLLCVLRRRSEKSPHATSPKMTSATGPQVGPETGWRQCSQQASLLGLAGLVGRALCPE